LGDKRQYRPCTREAYRFTEVWETPPPVLSDARMSVFNDSIIFITWNQQGD